MAALSNASINSIEVVCCVGMSMDQALAVARRVGFSEECVEDVSNSVCL